MNIGGIIILVIGVLWFASFVNLLAKLGKTTRSRRQDYDAYLESDHWRRTRRRKLRQAGHQCEVCGATERLEVHHCHYWTLGHESLDDLQVLCRPHHEQAHGLRPEQPA